MKLLTISFRMRATVADADLSGVAAFVARARAGPNGRARRAGERDAVDAARTALVG
jgi:hypothetical protein